MAVACWLSRGVSGRTSTGELPDIVAKDARVEDAGVRGIMMRTRLVVAHEENDQLEKDVPSFCSGEAGQRMWERKDALCAKLGRRCVSHSPAVSGTDVCVQRRHGKAVDADGIVRKEEDG